MCGRLAEQRGCVQSVNNEFLPRCCTYVPHRVLRRTDNGSEGSPTHTLQSTHTRTYIHTTEPHAHMYTQARTQTHTLQNITLTHTHTPRLCVLSIGWEVNRCVIVLLSRCW